MVSASSSRPATPTSFSTTVSTTAFCPSCCRRRRWISCSRKRLLRRVTSSRSISRRSASSHRAVMHSSSTSTSSANTNCSTASTTSVSPCSMPTRSRRMNNAAASRRRGCYPDRSTTHRIIIGTTDKTNKIAVLPGDGNGPELAAESSLMPEVVAGLDIMIVRELTGDIYFGQPRGIETRNGERVGYNTMVYSESEVRRVARVAFGIAMRRRRQLCSVEKANVLECSELWKEVVIEVGKEYPEVALTHMYVDNAAMQLVRAPKQFDVIVTGNIFGDILSDEASMLTGSIGMLPSASLDANNKGMYEPIHGSAPDIAGKGVANPLATILSVAMMLRYTLNEMVLADRVEAAVQKVLAQGYRTGDIYTEGTRKVGTAAMGDAVVAALRS